MVVPGYPYTKPRGPVGAMFKSPGPARYNNNHTLLGIAGHDPRSVHTRYPAYSLGKKLTTRVTSASPGPIYAPDTKLLRDGLNNPPKYTMAGRHGSSEHKGSPGPKYLPTNSAEPRPPAYSLGLRLPIGQSFKTPGPYGLPRMTVDSTKRESPSHSLAKRDLGPHIQIKGPGPQTYQTVSLSHYMLASPHLTIGNRLPMAGDRSKKPGPGAHNIDQIHVTLREMPKYTFGIKHSPYSGSLSSGPLNEADESCSH